MNDLQTYKFHKLYDFSSGISSKPEQAGHGSPFVSFSTVFNNYFVPNELNELMDSSLEEQEKYSILKGDILLTRTSETVDELAMSCVAIKDYPNVTYSGFLKRLRPLQNDITYDKYMAFYLRSKLFRKTMTNNAVLTLRASLNEQIFSYLDLVLPKYEEQVKIGNLLYSINQQIELNHKINQELEVTAKILYDYWFVQFDFPNADDKPYKNSGGKMLYSDELKREIPEGWEVKELSEIITRSGTGLNPRNNFKLGFGDNYYITIKNIKNGKVNFDEKCDRIDDEALKIINHRSQLQAGDVLFTSIEPVGITYLLHEKPTNWDINESVFTIRANEEEVTPEYLYMLLSSIEMKAFTKNVSAGSIHKGVRHGVLKTFKLAYSNKKTISQFTSIIFPMFKKIHNIDKENQKLTQLRDWLLPMLMNGQVKVADASEMVDELMVAEPSVGYGES